MEFLLDQDGQFYFIEMNTRIQVEHPVTEVTTGFDLVKEQIRWRPGNPSPCPRDRWCTGVTPSSFESTPRIRTGTSPPLRVRSPSTIRPGGLGCAWTPTSTPDTTYRPITIPYLGKLIVSGNNRPETIVRAQHVLESFVIEGISTTIEFLSRIATDPHFVSGDVDTGFVARFLTHEKEAR